MTDSAIVFDLSQKKKKKKKTRNPEDEDELNVAVEEEQQSTVGSTTVGSTEEIDVDEEFSFLKKKKKKKVPTSSEALSDPSTAENVEEKVEAENEYDSIQPNSHYSYQQMLNRIYGILRQRNPELGGDGPVFRLLDAKVMREGSKKTGFVNFSSICHHMGRDREHVMHYLLTELGTTGSIDSNHRLIIRGIFKDKQLNKVIQDYIEGYLLCGNCKSHQTTLTKENRLTFLRCKSCGASRTVQAIKAGFKAQTDRRSRRKT